MRLQFMRKSLIGHIPKGIDFIFEHFACRAHVLGIVLRDMEYVAGMVIGEIIEDAVGQIASSKLGGRASLYRL